MDPLQEYQELIRSLDEEVARVAALHGKRLACRPGCCTCCTELTLLPLEAAVVQRAWAELPADQQEIIRRQARQPGPDCPFLYRQRCLIYPSRPIICRTHGLPVAYVDPDREVVEVSACPLNFPPEHEFNQEELLFLDPYNERLLLSCRFTHTAGGPERLSMRALLAAAPPPD